MATAIAVTAFAAAWGFSTLAIPGWWLLHRPPKPLDLRDYPDKSALWKGAALVQQERQQWVMRHHSLFARATFALLGVGVFATLIAISA
jgi:hypothetical protein